MYSVPLEHGELITISVSDPAAATNATFTLPDNFRYKIHCVTFHLTTDANAANRSPNITVHDPAAMQRYLSSEFTIAASLAIRISWMTGLAYQTPDAVSRMTLGLPTDFIVNGATIIATEIGLMQVADQISEFRIFLARWPMQTV